MIYRMMQDMQARFTTRKFPVRFYFAPERTDRELFDTAIVMGRDTGKTDAISPAVGSKGPAEQMLGVRELASFAKIYANSSLIGAMSHDHEDFCEVLVDALAIEIIRWAKEHQRPAPTFVECRYLTPVELKAEAENATGAPAEVINGVVYLMRFRVARGMFDRDYNGEGALTNAPAGVGGKLIVSRAGSGNEIVPMPGR